MSQINAKKIKTAVHIQKRNTHAAITVTHKTRVESGRGWLVGV